MLESWLTQFIDRLMQKIRESPTQPDDATINLIHSFLRSKVPVILGDNLYSTLPTDHDFTSGAPYVKSLSVNGSNFCADITFAALQQRIIEHSHPKPP